MSDTNLETPSVAAFGEGEPVAPVNENGAAREGANIDIDQERKEIAKVMAAQGALNAKNSGSKATIYNTLLHGAAVGAIIYEAGKPGKQDEILVEAKKKDPSKVDYYYAKYSKAFDDNTPDGAARAAAASKSQFNSIVRFGACAAANPMETWDIAKEEHKRLSEINAKIEDKKKRTPLLDHATLLYRLSTAQFGNIPGTDTKRDSDKPLPEEEVKAMVVRPKTAPDEAKWAEGVVERLKKTAELQPSEAIDAAITGMRTYLNVLKLASNKDANDAMLAALVTTPAGKEAMLAKLREAGVI